ncbi:MAG: hypothetical protein IPP71_01190 [Bacteroidetes bacterium]|nr:hypothetical protein [Bacteroidota bacterium]
MQKNDTETPDIVIPSNTGNIRLVGMIVDESGLGVSGVTVKVGSQTLATDNDGFFVFQSLQVPLKRFYVSASRFGYFDAGFGGIPKEGGINFVRITLLAEGTPNFISSISGGTVTTSDGTKVIFPPNAFVTATGIPFVGLASIYIRHLSPTNINFSSSIPGSDLAALNSGGELVPLLSYGMLGVTILDNGGVKLKLASGKTAEIRMPIASSQMSIAPSTIPLLHFNSGNGIWKQDGTATKTGAEYIGTVSHFSWWNCDVLTSAPAPVIQGRVLDCQGNPLAGVVVTVNSQFDVLTNNLGVYSNWVPPGTPIVIQVLQSNNYAIPISANLVSISTTPGLNLVQDITVACPSYISGSVVNCDGNPISIYVWSTATGASSNATFSLKGNFVIPVVDNQSVAVHISNGQYNIDTVVTSGNLATTLNIGTVTFCNTGSTPVGCTGGPTQAIDIDGNVYNVVQIGSQCWMKENLKTSKYKNGDTIEYIPRSPTVDDSIWHSVTTGAYTSIDKNVYGLLYNWYTVADPRGLCPTGWHVADSADYKNLSVFLGGDAVAGGKLKQAGTSAAGTGLWTSPNTAATNISGFTGLPAGFRAGGTGGNGGTSYFWESTGGGSTTAWFRNLSMNNGAFSSGAATKTVGHSVRCVKD